jgi:hypothetical protein
MKTTFQTLQKAIDAGEFHPEVLAGFDEWNTLSRIMQFHLIRKALDIRERDLVSQYAEVTNVLDFSKKPELQLVLDRIQRSIKELQAERERLYVEYS